MKGTLNVFSFTFREQIRKKSYIFSTVILVLLVIAALCIPAVIRNVQSGGNGKSGESGKMSGGTLYIIDTTGTVGSASGLKAALKNVQVELKSPNELSSLEQAVKTSPNQAVAVLRENGNTLSFDYYIKSYGDGPDPAMLAQVFQGLHTVKLLGENGVTGKAAAAVLQGVDYQTHTAGKGMLSGYLPAILISLLLFMSIYMYGYWVAMSIASEKTSRVMELLITSTRPSRIIIGKSLAMGLLGLIQLLIVILSGVAAYQLAYPKNFSFNGLTIDFSAFTPFYAGMVVLYFLLGYALYAMINAVAGATVSNADDVRTAIAPISVIAVISFYFAYGTIMIPDSSAAAAASLIPFSAPFSMPSRILMSEVPAWQIAGSVLLLAAATALMTWISVRLYSAAVLHYGRRLKLSELFAMSRNR